MNIDELRPEMKGIIVAAIIDTGDVNPGDWNVYLANSNNLPIENVMITSRGYGILNDESRETSTIRWFFEKIEPHTFVMIEPIMEEVFGLTNEYYVSFYMDGIMYDKKYLFLPESIDQKYLTMVPVIQEKGVMLT